MVRPRQNQNHPAPACLEGQLLSDSGAKVLLESPSPKPSLPPAALAPPPTPAPLAPTLATQERAHRATIFNYSPVELEHWMWGQGQAVSGVRWHTWEARKRLSREGDREQVGRGRTISKTHCSRSRLLPLPEVQAPPTSCLAVVVHPGPAGKTGKSLEQMGQSLHFPIS